MLFIWHISISDLDSVCMVSDRFIKIKPGGNLQNIQAGRRLVRSLLTLRVFVVDVMDLRTGNRNEDDSWNSERTRVRDTQFPHIHQCLFVRRAV